MPTDDSKPTPSIEEILAEARTTLLSIKACGETAKTVSLEVVESQKATNAVLADAKARLEEITAAATQVVAAKTKITDDQTVIATKSAHIADAQKHADTVRADLDRELTAAKAQVTAAEALKSNAQAAAEATTKLLKDVQTAKGTVETDAAAIVTARKTAEESAVLTKSLADKSVTVEERIADYEKRLVELDAQCAEQLKTIIGLLPGATSAGLAHAFDERRQTFLLPHNRWQKVFVGSLVAIVALTISGLIQVYLADKVPTYDELFRLWLVRLPIAGALVWLALHASHQSALAKRLEEDYGFKAAVASCFEAIPKTGVSCWQRNSG